MKKLEMVQYLFRIIFTFLLLTACSTSYQPNSSSGGFSETQLDDNLFLVSFTGNGYTDNQKAVDFCLLRCSELCLSKGFNYFVVVANKESSQNSTYTEPADLEETREKVGNVQRSRLNIRGSSYTFSKPSVKNTIVCFKDKPEEISYNAKTVMKSVKEKYGME